MGARRYRATSAEADARSVRSSRAGALQLGAKGLVASCIVLIVASCTSSSSPSPSATEVPSAPAATASGPAPTATATPIIDKFVVGMDQFGNESFDPFAQGTPGKPYLEGLFDHLVGVNKAGTAVSMASGLADTWTVATDGLSISFHLRDAKFSNGTAVTSADVSYSLARNKDPQVGSPYASAVAGIIASVDTPDPQTVVIHMAHAVSTQLLSLLSPLGGESEGMVLPSALYQ